MDDELAVETCDVNDCSEDAKYGFVMNPGDGLRYEISVCEEHFDNESNAQDRAKAFLDAIVDLERTHGLTLAHEDQHGGFIVEEFDEGNVTWLLGALDNTDPNPK